MKKLKNLTLTLIAAISFASCSDDIHNIGNTGPVDQDQSEAANVVIQERNPNLPTIKKWTDNELKTKGNISGEAGNSDAFLGCGYNLKNGNYIIGDFSNVAHAIVDIKAIKAYDPTYVKGIRLKPLKQRVFPMVLSIDTSIIQKLPKR